MFPNCHLNTRGVGRIWDSYANQRGSRGLHNCREFLLLPECFDDAFKNYFSKIIRQIKGNAVYLLLDRKRFFDMCSYFLQANQTRIRQRIINQNACDVTAVLTNSHLNTTIDQWYFITLHNARSLRHYIYALNINTWMQPTSAVILFRSLVIFVASFYLYFCDRLYCKRPCISRIHR